MTESINNVPEVLDKMADVVLSYRPKEKCKKKRKRKNAKKLEDVETKS